MGAARALVPRSHPAGRRQTYPLRRIIDANFYLPRTGAQWCMLPHKYPPRSAVFYHFAQWRENGQWEEVTPVLRESDRRTSGRDDKTSPYLKNLTGLGQSKHFWALCSSS
jgi:putative transposase